MKFIILFEDNPATDPNIRTKYMKDHLAFLAAHHTQIYAAGPLHERTGDNAGGVWIIDVEDVVAAEALVYADPFWPTGLRQSFRVLTWTQVFSNDLPLRL